MTEEIKREYVIPLRRGFLNTPRYKRTNKAVRVLKEFLVKNMKSENIRIGPRLNLFLWKDGIRNPPAKVKVTVTKDKEGIVRAELIGFQYVDFKQIESEEPKNLKEKLQDKVKGTPRDAEGEVKQKAEISKPKAEAKPESEKPKVEEKVEVKPQPATSKPKPETALSAEEKLLETEVKEEALLEDDSVKTE